MQILNHEEQSLLWLKSMRSPGMTPEEVKAFFFDFQKYIFLGSNYLNNHFASSEVTRSFIITFISHFM